MEYASIALWAKGWDGYSGMSTISAHSVACTLSIMGWEGGTAMLTTLVRSHVYVVV